MVDDTAHATAPDAATAGPVQDAPAADAPATAAPAPDDPTVTDPDKYRTIFENDVVRVLEYTDDPGARTSPHRHPDSVMYTLSAFRRRRHVGDRTRDVELEAGQAHWLPAQTHAGENIGSTRTHVVFVELKTRLDVTTRTAGPGETLGPESSEHRAGVEQS